MALVLKAKAFMSCLFNVISFTRSLNKTDSEFEPSTVPIPPPLSLTVASSKALVSSSLSFLALLYVRTDVGKQRQIGITSCFCLHAYFKVYIRIEKDYNHLPPGLVLVGSYTVFFALVASAFFFFSPLNKVIANMHERNAKSLTHPQVCTKTIIHPNRYHTLISIS